MYTSGNLTGMLGFTSGQQMTARQRRAGQAGYRESVVRLQSCCRAYSVRDEAALWSLNDLWVRVPPSAAKPQHQIDSRGVYMTEPPMTMQLLPHSVGGLVWGDINADRGVQGIFYHIRGLA